MDLKIKDVASLLQVSEKTIYRWVNDHKIPSYKVNGQYRFKRDELEAWLQRSRQESPAETMDGNTQISGEVDLVTLLHHGGIFYKISGDNVERVIRNAVELLSLPEYCPAENVVTALLARENLASTAIGDGIAMPHSREPIFTSANYEQLGIFFLYNAIDFKALDKKPVNVLFLILSSDRRRHLQTVRQIAYLCRQPEFRQLLNKEALREEIIDYIASQRDALIG